MPQGGQTHTPRLVAGAAGNRPSAATGGRLTRRRACAIATASPNRYRSKRRPSPTTTCEPRRDGCPRPRFPRPVTPRRPARPRPAMPAGWPTSTASSAQGFAEGPDLVRGVRDGDVDHARVVAGQLDLLSVGLHAHHEGEDQRLWDLLDERAPACSVARRADEGAARRDAREPRGARRGAAGVARGAHRGERGAVLRGPRRDQRGTRRAPRRRGDHDRAGDGERPSPRPRSTGSASTGARRRRRASCGTSSARSSRPSRTAATGGCGRTCPGPVRLVWRWVGKPRYEKHRAQLTRG